jgi:uncharacterized protein YjbJ (UPF0337 family)
MISQQTMQANWNEIKGKLRSKWAALTDDDLAIFRGNVDQLVGTIQRKTGEARESIEEFGHAFRFGNPAGENDEVSIAWNAQGGSSHSRITGLKLISVAAVQDGASLICFPGMREGDGPHQVA